MRLSARAAAISTFAVATLVAGAARADVDGLRLRMRGEYRPRYLHGEGKNFENGGAENLGSHRARLGLGGAFEDWVEVYLELQDVRTFGVAGPGVIAAGALDLNQGWVRLSPLDGVTLTFGRQPLALLNHRIVGDTGWTQNTFSYDAARLRATTDIVAVDAFYAKTREQAAPPADDRELFGGSLGLVAAPFVEAHLVGLLDTELVIHQDTPRRALVTAGTYARGQLFPKTPAGLVWEAEAYVQAGADGAGSTRAAWLLASALQWRPRLPGLPRVRGHLDVVSGDATRGDNLDARFSTPFAKNHAHYGETDLFTDLPRDTGGAGLVDVGLVGGVTPLAPFSVGRLRGLRIEGGARAFFTQTTSELFATELSMRLRWPVGRFFAVRAYYAVLIPGARLRGPSGDSHENAIYLDLRATFDAWLRAPAMLWDGG